jgi:hypothetical protein
MSILSDMLCRIETKEKHTLPGLHEGHTLLVVSDYSGQHSTVNFESLSFLIADFEKCDVWEQKRNVWRKKCLPSGGIMAFKSLKDGNKARALGEFLDAADHIVGLSVTILVRKNIKTLFGESERIDWQNPELAPYRHWPVHTFEKMLRVVHFVSFFIAGFSRPNQNILWITDEDDIAANESRLRELTTILGNVSSHYLSHGLGHLRCGTTKSDDGSRQLEDLASIPDLVAGMLAEAVTEQRSEGVLVSGGIITPPPKHLRQKVIKLMNWFATNRKSLKRLVFLIESAPSSTRLEIKRLKFHGSNDLPD